MREMRRRRAPSGCWCLEDGGISKMDVVGGLREMGEMKETGGRWINGDGEGGRG